MHWSIFIKTFDLGAGWGAELWITLYFAMIANSREADLAGMNTLKLAHFQDKYFPERSERRCQEGIVGI